MNVKVLHLHKKSTDDPLKKMKLGREVRLANEELIQKLKFIKKTKKEALNQRNNSEDPEAWYLMRLQLLKEENK